MGRTPSGSEHFEAARELLRTARTVVPQRILGERGHSR